MNPNLLNPHSPNLVTALMEDRVREAAQLRMANDLPPAAEMGKPHRFRRFLAAARVGPRHATRAVEAR